MLYFRISKSNEIQAFRFFWDTRYTFGFKVCFCLIHLPDVCVGVPVGEGVGVFLTEDMAHSAAGDDL